MYAWKAEEGKGSISLYFIFLFVPISILSLPQQIAIS
jgi:hypothetical protein